MRVQTKEFLFSSIGEATDHPPLQVLDQAEEEFLEAFCELLAIGAQRHGDPIVIMPTGPRELH